MTETAPVAHPNPFKVGITLKGAAGFEAPWLTPAVYGATGDEVAKRVVELVKALADNGVIETVAAASTKMHQTIQPNGAASATAPKAFVNGQIVPKAAPAAPAGDILMCDHGPRTFREGHGAKGPWAAMFCGAPQGVDKSQQCPALWRQKNGSYA